MTTWADLRLPPPTVDSGYRIGLGLVRNRFRSGNTIQRRRYFHWPRQWRLVWRLTIDQWHTMSAFLAEYGADWFVMPLVSGQVADGALASHTVRMIGDISVSGEQSDLLRIEIDVEQASGSTPASIAGWTWPCAMLQGYSYGEAYGIVRTPFESYAARQKRLFTQRPRLFQLRWRLTHAQLAQAEAWMNDRGTSWHTLELLSGESGRDDTTPHTVRLASDLAVSYVGGGYAEMSATLEQSCANEETALRDYVPSDVLMCTTNIPQSIEVNLDAAGFAAAWGDETDWGRYN
jgi:hypothetical protein